jgi:hypothetical protein
MAELAIGGVSFFFQVFAGCIQGQYTYLLHSNDI